MSKLTTTIEQNPLAGGVLEIVFRLSGSLDCSAESRLNEELSLIHGKSPSRVVFDISSLRHLDPAGLECLGMSVNLTASSGIEAVVQNIPAAQQNSHLTARELEGVSILVVSGQLDMSGVAMVEEEFLRHFKSEGFRVLVDFSGTDLLSSLGIRLLLNAVKSAASRKGRVLFLNPSPFVSTALETAGLGHFIARGNPKDIAQGLLA